MKTNIKMRVTPEQSKRVQEICFENGFEWLVSCKFISNLQKPYLIIENYNITYRDYGREFEHDSNIEEIDADLFIRTNGACEEISDDVAILEQKLKKKNEILKKARIKRKNQREELNKLNLKLQKCISFEEHHQVVDELRKDINFRNETIKNTFQISKDRLKEIEQLNAENIEMGKLVNLNKSALDLAVITKELAMNEIKRKNKEIEKLKAVIEYLESKVK